MDPHRDHVLRPILSERKFALAVACPLESEIDHEAGQYFFLWGLTHVTEDEYVSLPWILASGNSCRE